MSDLMPSRTLHVSIERPPDLVHDFILTPERFPEWAPGFALAVHQDNGGGWVVQSSNGPAPIDFVGRNALGAADHTVTLADGLRVTNPIRVLPNGEGSEVTFTLFQRADVSAEEFELDAATVQSDLDTLKGVLEESDSA